MIRTFVILFILFAGISASLYSQSSNARLSYRRSFYERTSGGGDSLVNNNFTSNNEQESPGFNGNSYFIKLRNHQTLLGKYVESDDSTVTYQTPLGLTTLNKNVIMSVIYDPSVPTRKIRIEEYNYLPLLALPAAGAIWTYILLRDAVNYHDVINLLSQYNGTNYQSVIDQATKKRNTDIYTGIIVALVSAVLVDFSLTYKVIYIDQPVSIVPTSNGVSLMLHF